MKKLILTSVIAAVALTFSGCDLVIADKENIEPASKVEMSTGGDEPDPDRDN